MGFCNNSAKIQRNHLYALGRLVEGRVIDKSAAFDAIWSILSYQVFGTDYPDYNDVAMNPILAAFFASAEFSFVDLGKSTAMGERSGTIRAEKAKIGKSSEGASTRGGFRANAGRKPRQIASSGIPEQIQDDDPQVREDEPEACHPGFVPESATAQDDGSEIKREIKREIKESNGEIKHEIKREIKESNGEIKREIKGNQTALEQSGTKSNGNQTATNKGKGKDKADSSVRPSDGTDGRIREDASPLDGAGAEWRGIDERVVESARSGSWAATLRKGISVPEEEWRDDAATDARMLVGAYGRMLGEMPCKKDEAGKVWSFDERLRYWLSAKDANKVRELTGIAVERLLRRDRMLAMPIFHTIAPAVVDALRNGATWSAARALA